MQKKSLFFLILVKCLDHFKRLRNRNMHEYEGVIEEIKNSIFYQYHENHNFFEEKILKISGKIDSYLEVSEVSAYQTENEIMKIYSELLCKVLDSIVNKKYNNKLIKLICQTDAPEKVNPGNFSAFSVYTCALINEIMDILSNKEYISLNKEKFFDQFFEKLDESTRKEFRTQLSSVRDAFNVESEFFMRLCEVAYLKHSFSLVYCYLNLIHVHEQRLRSQQKTNFSTLNSYFYKAINDAIDLINCDRVFKMPYNYLMERIGWGRAEENILKENEFFLLLDYDSIENTKVSKYHFEDRDRARNAREIKIDFMPTKADLLEEKLDISYLEMVTFSFEELREFEFFLGLLQYHSEAQRRRIKCLYEAKSFKIKVLKTSPDIDNILKYFKSKLDITETFLKELKDNEEMYKDRKIETLVELKDYFFYEKENCTKVFCRCIRLSCLHILARELLDEFFCNDLRKCPFCNIGVRVIGYLEIDLYTPKEDSE